MDGGAVELRRATAADLPALVALLADDQLALADTMRAAGAGADVDAVVYDGAPHSFFDRAFGDWADACADAWTHLLALTDRVAAGSGTSR